VLPIPPFLCDNPASCEACLYAFPPGCLHMLREDERNSPEIYEIMPIVRNTIDNDGQSITPLWDRPENAVHVHERTVRFYFYMAVKLCSFDKTAFQDQVDCDRYFHARSHLNKMLYLYGIIKCGSNSAVSLIIQGDVDLDERQSSHLALMEALMVMYHSSYYGLVYVLNELSPCDCLTAEVNRARQEALQEERDHVGLLQCCNRCGEEEESDENMLGTCSRCRLSVYCCRTCQEEHWKGSTTRTQGARMMNHTKPHKETCKTIRELASYLAGGGGSSCASGNQGDST
jgi:MYND finger